jgi:hypothetical protein
MGQEPTSRHVGVMSVIPLKADIHQRNMHVRFVPRTDIDTTPMSHEAQVTRASVRNLTTRWTHKGPPLMDGGPLRLLSISYPGCFFE